jgi:hypothetical protein
MIARERLGVLRQRIESGLPCVHLTGLTQVDLASLDLNTRFPDIRPE